MKSETSTCGIRGPVASDHARLARFGRRQEAVQVGRGKREDRVAIRLYIDSKYNELGKYRGATHFQECLAVVRYSMRILVNTYAFDIVSFTVSALYSIGGVWDGPLSWHRLGTAGLARCSRGPPLSVK